ncbi:FtsX-like permease family protein [Mucilaginibacter sp. HC2]|uniref:ABC transporter permease n=1 Tax=Mucilaginibacter inviolabilis TaxID=2714892 RepID=UPI0014073D8A|nr:ABC transporter permease [Mucilaginibacter inviolabilis]NHA06552.1 FtsX-like permease family protein [Mucilaginibacter inviolabilis]
MLKNYLKIAWRNLIKNKVHTFINIAGLSVGLTCSLLILLWVQSELSVDAFHKNGARLYSIYERQYYDNKIHGQYNTPGLLAVELKKQIPEIEYATGNSYGSESTFQVGDKILKMSGTDVGDDYLKMFSFPILQGSAQTALNSPVSIAISRKMAVDFFGSPLAAIGKTIRYENKNDFKVTAVFEDMSKNSSQKYDYLMNWYHFVDANGQVKDWGNNWPATVIMLRADANPILVEKKLTHFLDNLNKGQKKGTFTIELGIQRFSDLYLHNNFVDGKIEGGRIGYVHLFTIVAIFILLIACINFMNLTTARSVKRAREIGVRKVVGAVRSVLIKQFIGESLLITSLAIIVSLVLLVLLLPVFNQVTRKEIELPFNQAGFWLKLGGLTLITGLISGSYPALFLSSFNPVKVLKGTLKLDIGTTLFRKGLVIFQFTLSVILITATIVISRQMTYVQSANLGYDRENLIYLPMNGELTPKYGTFKDRILGMPGIQSVTRVSNTPTIIENGTGGIQWVGKDPNVNIEFTQISVGYDFVKTMKLKVLAGRDYSKSFATDSVGYIINETALKRIGYKDPIGQPITQWGKPGKIIGLIKDFHFNSMHEQIRPLIIRFGEQENYGSLLIRTEPGKTKQALASLETLCRQINPAFPFTYTFSDQEYQKLYQNEQIVTKLSNAFAFLAIFISCLGLLGLAMFTAEQRVKEIGIRKVLGASVGSLFSLLSSEFLILVIIALGIALPVSWYAMNSWLQGFAYRTSLQWWMFGLSGMIIILIATVTVSFQAVKAALVNPIRSLRSE